MQKKSIVVIAALVSVSLAGCADKELSQQLQSSEVELAKDYSAIVFDRAKHATCFDLEDYFQDYNIDCSISKSFDRVMIGPYDLDANKRQRGDRYVYRRYIVRVETAAGKMKSVVDRTPLISGNDAKVFQQLLPKYDEFMAHNLELQENIFDDALALGSHNHIQMFLDANADILDPSYVDKTRIQKSLDDFFNMKNSNSELRLYLTNPRHTRNDNLYGTLRDEDAIYNFINDQIKHKVLYMGEIPVSANYCDPGGSSFKLCRMSGTPFKVDNAFSDNKLSVSSYYKYGGVNSYVIRVENKTDDYLTVSNLDVLFDEKYYSAMLGNKDIPPAAIREYPVAIPRHLNTDVEASDTSNKVPYGITARYVSNGQTYKMNQTRGYNPYLVVAN